MLLFALVTGGIAAGIFYFKFSGRMGADSHTVASRVKQFRGVVEQRCVPLFEKANAAWPPKGLCFVGLKEERELQVFATDREERLVFVHSYPILGASGRSGPKLREGDMQVPEGIYGIELLNPNSLFHLSLRINYPNADDIRRAAAEGRTEPGSDIMIHGGSGSIGCLAMGDEAAEDLFIMAALAGVKNIRVILAPYDFRQKAAHPPEGAPSWTSVLYTGIESALRVLPNGRK